MADQSEREFQEQEARRVAAQVQMVGELWSQLGRLDAMVRRSRLAPGRVDATPLVLEGMFLLLKGMALLMDESLAGRGVEPPLKWQSSEERVSEGKGNGKAGPSLVVPG